MSRKEFMERLEKLLRDISDSEREEALQYYNDYFDDAGAENEAEVLKELVVPSRWRRKSRRVFRIRIRNIPSRDTGMYGLNVRTESCPQEHLQIHPQAENSRRHERKRRISGKYWRLS